LGWGPDGPSRGVQCRAGAENGDYGHPVGLGRSRLGGRCNPPVQYRAGGGEDYRDQTFFLWFFGMIFTARPPHPHTPHTYTHTHHTHHTCLTHTHTPHTIHPPPPPRTSRILTRSCSPFRNPTPAVLPHRRRALHSVYHVPAPRHVRVGTGVVGRGKRLPRCHHLRRRTVPGTPPDVHHRPGVPRCDTQLRQCQCRAVRGRDADQHVESHLRVRTPKESERERARARERERESGTARERGRGAHVLVRASGKKGNAVYVLHSEIKKKRKEKRWFCQP